MTLFQRIVMAITIFGSLPAYAQKIKKSDKLVISQLESHISYLADDKMEGRRAGTPGEALPRTE